MGAEQPDRSGTGPARADRFPGLEWLRAGATVCVVLLHAAIPYATHRLPGLVWSTVDRRPSLLVDAMMWNINVWVMPLFFMLSGFLAAALHERFGSRGFIRHRLLRIGGPLLFGIFCILPLDLFAWMVSWVNQGWIEPVKLKSLKVEGPLGEGMWGLSHLWYLEYLLLYCLLAAGLVTMLRQPTSAREDSRGGEMLLAMPERSPSTFRSSAFTMAMLTLAVALLWWQPRILIGFRHSFLPLVENFVFFGIWFTLGWQTPRSVSRIAPSVCWWRLAGGFAGFCILWPVVRLHVDRESIPAATLWLPLLFVAVGWLLATGLLHAALRVVRQPPRAVAYVAEASFWIYLVHHPVVGLLQGNLAAVTWPGLLKFLIAGTGALTFSLLTYEMWVRRTLLGVLLNGRRRTAPAASTPGRIETRRAAA